MPDVLFSLYFSQNESEEEDEEEEDVYVRDPEYVPNSADTKDDEQRSSLIKSKFLVAKQSQAQSLDLDIPNDISEKPASGKTFDTVHSVVRGGKKLCFFCKEGHQKIAQHLKKTH